jgi:hypothetical protein
MKMKIKMEGIEGYKKITLEQATKVHRGSRVIALRFL